jgi:hypothetical protein
METKATGRNQVGLEDPTVPTKVKLSAAWASLMFLYIYADYIGLFRRGMIEDLMAGEVWVFTISQGFLIGVSVLMSIPALMIFASIVVRPVWNRRLNIGVGALKLVVAIAAVIGDDYVFYYYFTAIEVALLVTIIRMAWRWPRLEVVTTAH